MLGPARPSPALWGCLLADQPPVSPTGLQDPPGTLVQFLFSEVQASSHTAVQMQPGCAPLRGWDRGPPSWVVTQAHSRAEFIFHVQIPNWLLHSVLGTSYRRPAPRGLCTEEGASWREGLGTFQAPETPGVPSCPRRPRVQP